MRQRGFFTWGAIAVPVVIVGALSSHSVSAAQRSPATERAEGSSSSLGSLSNKLQAEEKATFKAVYVDRPVSGASSTITFEQESANTVVKLPSGNVLTTGGKSYFCASESGHPMCFVGEAAAYTAIIGLFNPAVIVSELKALEQEVSLKAKGVTVSSSSKTIAGQSAQCETVTVKTGSSTWCVDGKGYLAYASTTGGSSVTLQSYTTSVPASDLKVPTGAKIETIPGSNPTTSTTH